MPVRAALLRNDYLVVTDPNGAPGDRVNFIVIGSEDQMQAAFKAAIDEAVPAHVLTAALYERFRSRALTQLADQLLGGTVSKDHDSQVCIEKEDSWHGSAIKKVAGILFC